MSLHGVRRADTRDLASWMAMRLSLWPDADETVDALLAQLEENDQLVLLAFDADGQAIGFAEATLRHDYVNGTESSPVGFLVADDFHRPFDAHLHAVAHARPVEQQRGVRIGLQFAALAPVQVRVEHETARVVCLEQHRARRRSRVEAGGGDGHRGAVGLAGTLRFVEQRIERGEGFFEQVGRVHCAIVGRCRPVCTPPPDSTLRWWRTSSPMRSRRA